MQATLSKRKKFKTTEEWLAELEEQPEQVNINGWKALGLYQDGSQYTVAVDEEFISNRRNFIKGYVRLKVEDATLVQGIPNEWIREEEAIETIKMLLTIEHDVKPIEWILDAYDEIVANN